MKKIKVFRDSETYTIQKTIDDWLKDKNIDIISVSGCMGDSYIVTYVLYEEKSGVQLTDF